MKLPDAVGNLLPRSTRELPFEVVEVPLLPTPPVVLWFVHLDRAEDENPENDVKT